MVVLRSANNFSNALDVGANNVKLALGSDKSASSPAFKIAENNKLMSLSCKASKIDKVFAGSETTSSAYSGSAVYSTSTTSSDIST